MTDIYCVYKHTSPSGKSYIGITNDYTRRCQEHQRSDTPFGHAIRKYGWDNFTHTILIDGIALSEANELETVHITEFNTLLPNGYNQTTGGGVMVFCEASRQKMSNAQKGKKRSPEHCAAISEALKRRVRKPRTAKTTEKIRKSREANGKFMSQSHKDAILRGVSRDYIVTTPTGEEIVVTNLSQFCRLHDLTYSVMYKVCRGFIPQHKGWMIRYK